MKGTDTAIAQLRRRFFSGQPVTPQLEPVIARSWHRCRSEDLAPDAELDIEPIGRADLLDARDRARILTDLAAPKTDMLHALINGSNAMVLLADAGGTVIDASGDSDIVGQAQRVSLAAGADWSETRKGTNAIGTALIEGRAVEVHGAEHYFDRLGFLTCACAPVFDPFGELVGALDITSHSADRQAHTLGLVSLTAELIEQQMFKGAFPRDIVVHLHRNAHSIGTPGSAILVVREDGRIRAMNRHALLAFGLDRAHIGTASLADISETGITQFHQQAMASDGKPIAFRLHSGEELQARAEISYARLRAAASGASVPSQRPALMAPEPVMRLADLDTGDRAVSAILDRLRKVIGRDIPLLIEGETGVGKEVLARAVHVEGPRANAPFIAINCAAIPESLIESELFGHMPGAFTGASAKGAPGRIREADKGTLFLDEIGEMSRAMQMRLLRVLQERVVSPVGGGPDHRVDINIVCATNADLGQKVAEGAFRADLYHRVAGLSVTLPALRERSDLAEIISRLMKSQSAASDKAVRLSEQALDALLGYSWPGNIRELKNVLATATAFAENGVIDIGALPDSLTRQSDGARETGRLDQAKIAAVESAVARHGGNIAAAARDLGISRTTLYKYRATRH